MKFPLEQQESEYFSLWLKTQNIAHHHGNDNMYSKSWGQKIKMKKAGFSKGFPDFTIYIDENKSVTKNPILIYIEMKRKKGGVLSEEQKEWLEKLKKVNNVDAFVANGADEAIKIIQFFIK